MTGEVAALGSEVIVDKLKYDLCKDCADLFMRWLNTKPVVEERIIVTSVNKIKSPEVEQKVVDVELTKELLDKILQKTYPVKMGKVKHHGNTMATIDLNQHKRTLCINGLTRSGFKSVKEVLNYAPRKYNDAKLYRISTKTFLEVQRLLRKEYPDLCESGTSN
jgi:hypothetical protein